MSIEAQIQTDVYGNITLQMKGGLDYENSIPLREQLQDMAKENPAAKITLDMTGVDFVGSSGIGAFIETLRIVNRQDKDKVLLSNVKTEFLKVFKLYVNNVETLLKKEDIYADFDDEFEDNDSTSHMAQAYANRRQTFAN